MNSRQAERLYQRLGRPAPAGIAAPSASKFNARKKLVDGILFDSGGEARAYQLLKLWERAGTISKLELQPRYKLLPRSIIDGQKLRPVNYKPDFRFLRDGRTVVVEFKGYRSEAYILRRKMFAVFHPEIQFEEWTKATLASL